MKNVKENQGTKAIETTLKTIEVKTRLDNETAQKAVTKEQERQIKIDTIDRMVEDFQKSIEQLETLKYNPKELITDFEKDFDKNEKEYKGVFALFNHLAKGKEENSLNKSFFECKLDKKYKFGKDYNGVTLLACLSSSDLVSQLNNPQKFSTSQFKRAFKTFNKHVTSFEAFEVVNNRAKEINELIKSLKDNDINELEYINSLNGLGFYENQRDKFSHGLSDQAKKKVCSRVYTKFIKED